MRTALTAVGSLINPVDYVFTEQARATNLTETDSETMVRSRDWKLVHFLAEPHGQLFNLNSDPDGTHNLWDACASRDEKRELLDVLRESCIRGQCENHDWNNNWK
jgi:arylsulfatase A-like enzyme